MNSKADLRKAFRARFNEAVPAKVLSEAQTALNERLTAFLKQTVIQSEGSSPNGLKTPFASEANEPAKGPIWAAYQPHGFEPDLQSTLLELSHFDWVFPRVFGETLQFYRPHHESSWLRNHWGIGEPDPDHSDLIRPESIVGFLVPGLAFDPGCRRLGRGKGYYDRFLAPLSKPRSQSAKLLEPQSQFQPLKIGIAYDRQISTTNDLPTDPHDVVMDAVMTETSFYHQRAFSSSFERKSS